MYVLADKYDIPLLTEAAYERYSTSLYCPEYEKSSVENYVEFFESITPIYSVKVMNKHYDIRQRAVKWFCDNYCEFEEETAGSDYLKSVREEAIRNTPEFAVDVLMVIMKVPLFGAVCGHCAARDNVHRPERKVEGRCAVCSSGRAKMYRLSGVEDDPTVPQLFF